MTTATGITLTCERATNEGIFAMSSKEAFFKLGGSIDKLESQNITYYIKVHWDIIGTCSACPECFNELKSHDNYCSECGEEVNVYEEHKTLKEAEKSKNADIGITEKVTFWARVKITVKDSFELEA